MLKTVTLNILLCCSPVDFLILHLFIYIFLFQIEHNGAKIQYFYVNVLNINLIYGCYVIKSKLFKCEHNNKVWRQLLFCLFCLFKCFATTFKLLLKAQLIWWLHTSFYRCFLLHIAIWWNKLDLFWKSCQLHLENVKKIQILKLF